MFSTIRKRATYANVAATLALLFAMSGGALAASKIIITNINQIKPSVQKQLKATGPKGATGAPGTQGAQGSPGTPGSNGGQGTKGDTGSKGDTGQKGEEGSPWTAGGVLPSGKTERGVWTFHGRADTGALFETSDYIPISFLIPLGAAINEAHIEIIPEGGEGKAGGGCEKGKIDNPIAKPGYFCLYTQILVEAKLGVPGESIPALRNPETNKPEEIGKSGAQLQVYFNSEGEYGTGYGVWAVTAP